MDARFFCLLSARNSPNSTSAMPVASRRDLGMDWETRGDTLRRPGRAETAIDSCKVSVTVVEGGEEEEERDGEGEGEGEAEGERDGEGDYDNDDEFEEDR